MATGFDTSSARWANIKMAPEIEHAAAIATRDFLLEIEKAARSAGNAAHGDELLSKDFEAFDEKHLDFIIATLATGEVRIAIDDGAVKLEETQITGLWRVEENGKQRFVLASVPRVVLEHVKKGKETLDIPAQTPEGVFAAPSILQEMKANLEKADLTTIDFNPPPVIELTRQPLERADMVWLNSLLGVGKTEIWLSGFANAHIKSTLYRGIWRSTLLNRAGKGLLDSFVVTLLPPEVPASPDEFEDTARQCHEMIEWLDDDLARGTL